MAPISARLHAVGLGEQSVTIRDLTVGQQALFAFWMLYVHAEKGLSSCGREIPHRVASPGFWMLLQGGLQRMGDTELLDLVVRWKTLVDRTIAGARLPPEPNYGHPSLGLEGFSGFSRRCAP